MVEERERKGGMKSAIGLVFIALLAMSVVPSVSVGDDDDFRGERWIEGGRREEGEDGRWTEESGDDEECTCDLEGCCTLTQGYWKNHNHFLSGPRNISWPALCLNDCFTSLTEDNLLFVATGLNSTWLEILSQPPRGDACIIAARQWIAAVLNRCNGACTVLSVDWAIWRTQKILDNPNLCPLLFAGHKKTHLLSLKDILEDYNEGRIGPGACGH